jgi:hydrogenase nickel incorporation protein HypB
MCEECGCGIINTEKKENDKYPINKSVTAVNDLLAEQISEFLAEKKILSINLMGAPGSGKTTFIEGICHHVDPSELVVIQGDLESDIDKKRLEKNNVMSYQINTHSGCHLTSAMINKALLHLDVTKKKYLIIENVGNLVCPAGQKIGQHINIVVSSTVEGTDKPKKYPYIFIDANLVVLSKYDLVDKTDFNEERYWQDIRHINAKATLMKTSSKDTASFKQAAHFIEHQRDHLFGIHHTHKKI